MLHFLSNLHHAIVAFFSQAFAPGRIGVTLAIIALIVSIVNAVTGISNFVLSRFRLIKVRQIRAYASVDVENPRGAEYFEVDVLSYGAAVWDISVEVNITVPLKKKFAKPGFMGAYTLELGVAGEKPNPLNGGQGVTFQMKRARGNQQLRDFCMGTDFGPYFDEIAPAIPRRNICLCVYSGREKKTRKLLKRIRSRRFHWAIDCHMRGVFKVRPSWWRRTWGKVGIWWTRRQSGKFQNWMKAAGAKDPDNKAK
ncbi:MAG: hypothetical protein ABSB42_06710 [Tepidisphaeraceae bacterium]|jgi:hypothetical protein